MLAMIVIVVILIAAVNIVNWYQTDLRLGKALNEIAEFRINTGQLGNPQDYMDAFPGKGPDDSADYTGSDGDEGLRYDNEENNNNGFTWKKPDMDDFRGPKMRQSALTQYGSRYFIAIIDENGQVTRVEQQQDLVSVEDAEELVESLPEDYYSGGYVNGYKYRYLASFDDKTAICFLDCTTDMHSLNSVLLISILVGTGGIMLAFLFILKMSRLAVEPVRISIEKQKQFITNAGHELKTPLTSIATNMDILTMDLGENEWVDSTKKQVRRMRKLVENLVSLSKLEEDDSRLAMQDFSVSDIVEECADSFEPVAELNGKSIETHIIEGLMIQGDPGTVQQMISILCDNAVKYSAGDGQIEIRLYDDGKNICFETANEWEQNVDDDKIDELFERFYRGDPARNPDNKSSGHGLGLSIAMAIAEKNDARLTAEKDESGRLVFRVKFKK